MNFHIRVLEYLKQFEGDGNYHPIENLFDNIENGQIANVIEDLKNEELIKAKGGFIKHRRFMTIEYQEMMSSQALQNFRKASTVSYIPYEGKITFKGVEYLNSLKMKNEININGNNNSVIQNSPYAFLQIQNQPEVIEKINEIIEKLKVDNIITEEKRQQTSIILNQLLEESRNGKPQKNTLEKVQNLLQTGDSLSSIGSLVVSLLSYFQ